jgi:IS30 family transposase
MCGWSLLLCKYASHRLRRTQAQRYEIYAYRKIGWTQTQIAKAIIRGIPIVSVERIYQYIRQDKKCGCTLYKHLRHRLKHRKRYAGAGVRNIPNRVPIQARPPIVAKRSRYGDFNTKRKRERVYCYAGRVPYALFADGKIGKRQKRRGRSASSNKTLIPV